MRCGYDSNMKIVRTPLAPDPEKPKKREKGEMHDYIGRAISRIRDYAPPDPALIDHAVANGRASFGPMSGAMSEVMMTEYYQDGDSMVFTYETISKRLVRVAVSSNLSGRKDPVTLDAVFELLPDDVIHLAAATLKGPSKKVQVNVRNIDYKKLVN